jgi:RNA polymerase sigma factor (TIGR02999 family)
MPEHQITGQLEALRKGDPDALDRLLPLVYEELGRIARRQRRAGRASDTLNTTALVHEAYLKLVDQTRVEASDRVHFFAIAARAMRQVLIDRARQWGTLKRGGGWKRVPLSDSHLPAHERADLLLALDDAVTHLSALDERLGRIVECRFFGGMTDRQTAEALAISERTVRRGWLKAKLWLYGELVER